MNIMQGDAYKIPFILYNDSTKITSDMVSKVEIVIGTMNKTWPEDIEYSEGEFLFPLTQAESIAMQGKQPAQVRIKFTGGTVIGARLPPIDICDSRSKAVL